MIKEVSLKEVLPLRSKYLRNYLPEELCEFETDKYSDCLHFAHFLDEKVVSIASCFAMDLPLFKGKGLQVRALAVDERIRNQGLATQMLAYILTFAKEKGFNYIWGNSRKTAYTFYEKLNFQYCSDEFELPFSLHTQMMQFTDCKVTLQNLSREKIPKMRELALQIWNDYYPEIIGQELNDFLLSEFYNEQKLEEEYQKGREQILMLQRNGIEVGFISFSLSAEALHIHKFYLEKECRGMGLGKLMFFRVLQEARKNEKKSVTLYVHRKNPSVNLYKKLGFVTEKEEDRKVKDYILPDFLMRKEVQYFKEREKKLGL